jgi:hypothetical protein
MTKALGLTVNTAKKKKKKKEKEKLRKPQMCHISHINV